MHRIGPYEVVRELGRGGAGVVYAARSPRLDRLVAIKVLQAGAEATPDERERFEAEARAAARLRHSGIVGVHESGEHEGAPYLVMDLIEGETLAARVAREGPLDPREAAHLACGLARALAHAHGFGVLHRDVKPQNVLLGATGQAVLADFGIAKDLRRAVTGTSRTGEPVGTPAYMSPEQARGERGRIDARSDVYGLGATLYELLAGRPPFTGDATAVLEAVLARDPLPLRALRRGLDRDLETICARCLEKEPEARYGSALELADDLARFLADEPILARPPGPLERARKWARRNRTLARALGAIAALALAVGLAGGAAFLVELRRARDRADAERRRAEELAQRARDRAQVADDALEALVTRVSKQLEAVPGERVRAVRRRLLGHALEGAERLRALEEQDAPGSPAAFDALLQVADLALEAGDSARAAEASDRALALARALDPRGDHAGAFLVRAFEAAGTVARARGDLPAAMAVFRELVERCRARLAARRDPGTTDRYHLAVALQRLAHVVQRQGDLAAALLATDEALAQLAPLADESADCARELVTAQLTRAQLLEARGELDDAVAELQAAIARQRRLAGQPDDADGVFAARSRLMTLLAQLARVHRQRGDVVAASDAIAEAVAIGDALRARDPTNVVLSGEVGSALSLGGEVLRAKGDLPAALLALDRARDLLRRLVAEDPEAPGARSRLATTLGHAADVREDQGDLAGASRDYGEACGLYEQLVALDPTDAHWRRQLAMAQGRAADLAGARGDLAAQVAACDSSLLLRRELAALEPTSFEAAHDLARALLRAGEARGAKDGLVTGLTRWQEAEALARQLLERQPQHASVQQTFANARDRVGDVHLLQGDDQAAQPAFEEALAVRLELVARDPHNAVLQHALAVSFGKVGDLAMVRRDPTACLDAYERAERILRDLVARDGGSASSRGGLAVALERGGTALRSLDELPGARAKLEESLRLRRAIAADAPESVEAMTEVTKALVTLAQVVGDQGEHAAARALVEEAVRLVRGLRERDPADVRLLRHLSFVLDIVGDLRGATSDVPAAADAYDESIQISRELLRRTPRAAAAWRDLAVGLMRAGNARTALKQRAAAVTVLTEAVKIWERLAEKLPRMQRDLEFSRDLLRKAEALPAEPQGGGAAGASGD